MIGKLKRHLKEACMGERGKDEDRERGRLRIRERVCVYTCGYRSVNGRRDAGIATAEDTMVLKRERERERERELEREREDQGNLLFLITHFHALFLFLTSSRSLFFYFSNALESYNVCTSQLSYPISLSISVSPRWCSPSCPT